MTVDDIDEAIDNLVTNAGGRPTDIKAIRTDLRAYRAEAATLDPYLEDEGLLTRLQHQIVSLIIIICLSLVLFGIIYSCMKNWQLFLDIFRTQRRPPQAANHGNEQELQNLNQANQQN